MIERRSLFAWIASVAGLLASTRWFRNDALAQGGTTMTEQEKIDLFLKHVGAEIEGDMETTMATMTDNPHLTNVPTRIGGYGYDGVRAFYQNHLVGKFFPPDMTMTPVSRTVGENQIVDELVISFTHTTEIEWMLPGVAPTGKKVEVAFAVIVGIEDGRISHEHIYWDQATVLAQIGLLDPTGLPVVGADGARRILDPSLHAKAVP